MKGKYNGYILLLKINMNNIKNNKKFKSYKKWNCLNHALIINSHKFIKN